MEFRILGTLQVCDGDREISVGGKQRALLARLLLQPNRPVSEDLLIEALWGDEASARAADNLHVLVSRLRRTLGRDRVVRDGPGYLLRVDEGELDAAGFERLRGEGEPREALGLWRGDPLADFTYEAWAQNEIRRLEELRLATLEDLIEADLAAGRHGELIGELRALVAQHPLRETLRRHLIVALYRSERQAEALDAYREARRMLDEELGLEPTPALRELEGAVLRHDASLERPRLPPGAAAVSSRRRRRATALAAAAVAIVAGFATSIAAIEMLSRGEADRISAAAATRDERARGPNGTPPTPPATTRMAVIRERPAPAPRPKRNSARRQLVPSSQPVPPPPPPPPPPPNPPPAPPPAAAPEKKPKPEPQPAPPPARPRVRISDNFDDGLFDRTIWHRSVSNGLTLEERDGRLEVTLSPDAVAEGDYKLISASYGTTCRYLGDFDARVEFELLDWPGANGAIVQLAAWFNDANAGVVRQSQTWAEEYGSWMAGRNKSSPSADTRGALRMRRTGGTITTYYRRGQGWYPIQTAWGFNGAPIIGLQVMSKDEWFADKAVRVAFDNFTLTAARPAC